MIRLVAILVLLALGAVPARANDDSDPTVAPEDDGFNVGVEDGNEVRPPRDPTQTADPIGIYHQEPACDGLCAGDRLCPDGTIKFHSWLELPSGETTSHSFWCPADGAPPVTDHVVARAFRHVPLPPSTFTIQPPGGKTLVNFETNFFTDQDPTLARTVHLLGQRVDLRIEVHSYTWHFAEGESMTTTKPGAPFPRLQVTHNYLQTGSYRPALDITWVADYRVAGGAWQPVPGSVTIAGGPVELRAIEARPTLVGYEN
jgi:hypothetical protein